MLYEINAALKTRLTAMKVEDVGVFELVEYYEGQLEDLANFQIKPNHAFVGLEIGNNETENCIKLNLIPYIILVTNHMIGDTKQGMYDLIDSVIAEFHNTALATDTGYHIDRIFFSIFEELAVFPGICVFKLSFRIGSLS